MSAHSSLLTWRIPWTEEPGSYSPWGRTESDTTEVTQHTHTYIFLELPRWLRGRESANIFLLTVCEFIYLDPNSARHVNSIFSSPTLST